MKLAVSADIHFSAYSQDPVIDGLPERLGSLKKSMTNMIETCGEKNVFDIAIAGDLCHNKSIIHTTAQNVMLDIFQKKEYQDFRFYVIDGNHDLSGKGADSVSALKSLETIGNVRWISHQSKGECYHSIEDGKVAFVPYYPEMKDQIKKITDADILISHFGLNEAMLSSGISIQSSIRASDLKKFKLVVIGHYHLPQHMVYKNTHIYYTGSPIQLDWGEKHEEKRYLIIDTESFEVESIPTIGYKKYVELSVTSENKTEMLKEAKDLRDDGHHVKLHTTEKLDFTSDMKDIKIVEDVEEDITNRGITAGMDEITRNKKYLEIKEIPEREHEAYLNTAKEIIDGTELPD
jgi:DNA repair exonuclease SbcCD nuclease subunit